MKKATTFGRVAAAAAVVLVTGCGGSLAPATNSRSQVVSARGQSWLMPYAPSPQDYRWLDIADNAYSTTFQSSFKYAGNQVQVTYADAASSLEGTLTATALKPNFAYQIKLEGKPTATYPWTANDLKDPLNWTNKQLGSLGRWWCVNCGWNVADNQLSRHRGHMILGYLLFDFFVTDNVGSATQAFSLDSSFHVLWKTSQRAPGPNDGAPRDYVVIGSGEYAYPGPVGPEAVSIYAEWEPNRPLPGQVVLPAGTYQCRLLLAEESFHNKMSGYPSNPLGGFWASALSDESLSFAVTGGVGAIAGKVTNAGTGKAIRGATVTVDSGQSATTNGRGQYQVDGVAAGSHVVTASATGYLPATNSVTVTGGQTAALDFALTPSK